MNYTVVGFVESIIMIFTYLTLFVNEKRKFCIENKTRIISFVVLNTIMQGLIANSINNMYKTLLIIFSSILLIAYLLKRNVLSAIISNVCFIFITAISEITAFLTLSGIFNVDVKSSYSDLLIFIAFNAIAKTISVLLILLLNKFQFKIFNNEFFNKEPKIFIYFILQIYLIVIIFFMTYFKPDYMKDTKVQNMFIVFMLIALIVFNYYDYINREKLIKSLSKLNEYKSQNKELSYTINKLREQRHDFNNHLVAIKALSSDLSGDNVVMINNYTNDLLNEYSNISQTFNTGNETIDGLLALKYESLSKNQIDLLVRVEEKIEDIDIENNLLVSVISNIIDNAKDALIDQSIDNKYIDIIIKKYAEFVVFEIANNGEKIPEKTIEKTFQQDVSTKDNQKASSGFSLPIIKRIIEQNSGMIDVQIDEKETRFFISIKRKNKL